MTISNMKTAVPLLSVANCRARLMEAIDQLEDYRTLTEEAVAAASRATARFETAEAEVVRLQIAVVERNEKGLPRLLSLETELAALRIADAKRTVALEECLDKISTLDLKWSSAKRREIVKVAVPGTFRAARKLLKELGE